jgi:two-component system NarL family sensor kinase
MDIGQSVIDAPATPKASRSAARAAALSTVRLDGHERVLRSSASAPACPGYKPDELLGRALDELAASDWRTAVDVAMARMRAGAAGPFELMLTGRTGRLTMVEMVLQTTAEQSGDPAVTLTWIERRQRRLTASTGSADEEELKRLADGVLRVFESESGRVAASLSDEVASIITMARYVIEDAAQRIAHGTVHETSEALQRAGEHLRDAGARVLAIAGDLRPRLLDDLGLLPALACYCREFSRQHRGILVSQRMTLVEGDVPQALKLTMFRIVQASLSNVARHSKASAARLLVTMIDDELRLVIEDNGVGFDVERWQQGRLGHDGCGLLMTRRWAEASGGQCSFESTPRHGSRVQALWRLESAQRLRDRSDPALPDPVSDVADSPGR